MTDTELSGRARGRPRAFDKDAALAKAQALFHARGYDAVGIATLTEALGINPPSFYAAFGSKAALFDAVLARYAASALPLDALLSPGRDVPDALADLLETAARTYVEDPAASGCLVLESARATLDSGCTAAARGYRTATRARVRDFIAATRPEVADLLADYVDMTLSGLSAGAREAWGAARLVAAAGLAAEAIRHRWNG